MYQYISDIFAKHLDDEQFMNGYVVSWEYFITILQIDFQHGRRFGLKR